MKIYVCVKDRAKSTIHSRSENVIFFLHGAGWVGKFGAADLVFLSHWCNDWEAPVVSVDYT